MMMATIANGIVPLQIGRIAMLLSLLLGIFVLQGRN
jgi:hypothetical protein